MVHNPSLRKLTYIALLAQSTGLIRKLRAAKVIEQITCTTLAPLAGQQLPLPITDSAPGMKYNLCYSIDMTDYLSLTDVQAFQDEVVTVPIDYSQGVFYTRWGNSARDDDQAGFAARTCFSDPYLWTNQVPDSDTMKIYTAHVGDGKDAAVRVDFSEGSTVQGYHDTCQTGQTFDSTIAFGNTLNDPLIFHFVRYDTVPDNADTTYGLYAVQHQTTVSPNGIKFGDHPFHHGVMKISLYFDPLTVRIIGSQNQNDREISTRTQYFGIYYQVVDVSALPICNIADHVASLSLSVGIGTSSSYQHSFSLDSSASCLELPPVTADVTTDYAYPGNLATDLQLVTPGDYSQYRLVVTPSVNVPVGQIMFTFNYGIDVRNSQPLQQIEVLQLEYPCDVSDAFTGNVGGLSGVVSLPDNSATFTISFPAFAQSQPLAFCRTFTIAETTTGTTMAQQDPTMVLTLDDSQSPTGIQVPAMTQNLVSPGLYEFTIFATSPDGTSVNHIFNLDVKPTDPCMLTGFNLLMPFTDITHALWEAQQDFSWTTDADFGVVSIDPTSCGDFVIEFWEVDSLGAPLQQLTASTLPSVDISSQTLSVPYTSDPVDVGVVYIAAKISLVSYPSGPSAQTPSITLTIIDPCVFTFDSSGTNLPLPDNEAAHTIVFPSNTYTHASYLCRTFTIAETTTGTSMASQDPSMVLTLDDAQSPTKILVPTMTQNLVLPGLYEFTIYATSLDGTIVSHTLQFTVSRTDPCWTTGFTLIQPFSDITHMVYDPTQDVFWSSDLDFGVVSIDPVSCGDFVIEFWKVDSLGTPLEQVTTSTQPSLSVDTTSRKFSILETQDPLDAGIYYFSAKISLADYSLGPSDYTPLVTLTVIDPCAVPTIVPPDHIDVQEYTILSEAETLTLPKFTLIPSICSYSYSYSSDLQSYLTVTEIFAEETTELDLIIQSDDLSLTSTEGPDFATEYQAYIYMTSGATAASAMFTIRMKNPCNERSSVQILGQGEGARIDFKIGIDQPYVYQTLIGLYPSLEICGAVGVTVSPSDGDHFTFDSTTGELLIYTEDQQKGGYTDRIQVQSYLVDYPLLKGAVELFTVNYIKQQDYVFESTISCTSKISASYVSDLTFVLGDPLLVIPISAFDGGDAELNCGATWDYELIVTGQEDSNATASDYFEFDKKSLRIEILAGANLAQTTFSLMVKGTLSSANEDVKTQQLVVNFMMTFTERIEQDLGPVPRAFIKSINERGRVLISFDQDMVVPKLNDTQVESEGTTLRGLSTITADGKLMGVPDDSNEFYVELQKAIEVLFDSDNVSVIVHLEFSYRIDEFKKRELDLQLLFESPQLVSKSSSSDQLMVRFKKPEMFRTVRGQQMEENYETESLIGPQVGLADDTGEAIAMIAQTTVIAITVNSIAAVLINMALNQSLGLMIQLVKQLQLIVHLLLLDIILPSSTANLFSSLIGILTFDPIDIQDQVADAFALDSEADLNIGSAQNFKRLDYSSPYALINFGSLCLFVLIQFAFIAIYFIIYKSKCCGNRCTAYSKRKLDSFFFNDLITFFDGSLLILVITCQLNAYEVFAVYGQAEVNGSLYVSFIVLVLCMAYWVSQIILLFKYKDRLEEPKIKTRFGKAYAEFKIKDGLMQHAWYANLMIMRVFVFSWFIVNFDHYLVIQVLAIQLSTIAICSQLGSRPFKEEVINKIDFVGEAVFLFVSSLLMIVSDPIMTDANRNGNGIVVNTLVMLYIAATQGLLFHKTFVKARHALRRRKYKKALEDVKAAKALREAKDSTEVNQIKPKTSQAPKQMHATRKRQLLVIQEDNDEHMSSIRLHKLKKDKQKTDQKLSKKQETFSAKPSEFISPSDGSEIKREVNQPELVVPAVEEDSKRRVGQSCKTCTMKVFDKFDTCVFCDFQQMGAEEFIKLGQAHKHLERPCGKQTEADNYNTTDLVEPNELALANFMMRPGLPQNLKFEGSLLKTQDLEHGMQVPQPQVQMAKESFFDVEAGRSLTQQPLSKQAGHSRPRLAQNAGIRPRVNAHGVVEESKTPEYRNGFDMAYAEAMTTIDQYIQPEDRIDWRADLNGKRF